MATFPNRRRNEMISGTLSRPADVRSIDDGNGTVLIDPEMEPPASRSGQRMRELQRLSGRTTMPAVETAPASAPVGPAEMFPITPRTEWNYAQNRATPVASAFGSTSTDDRGLFPIQQRLNGIDRTVAGIAGDTTRMQQQHELYPIRQQLPQFHGAMYAAPLDGATEQRLADMRQPISNGSPDFDPNSPRMQGLRAAAARFPINTQATPLPFSQDRMEEIKQRRLADEAAAAERRANMTDAERAQLDKQALDLEMRGRAINAKGLAMQRQNERADVNLTNDAQAQRLMREQPGMDPLQATAAVQSGMYGVRRPMPDEAPRTAGDVRESVGMMLNAPDAYAAHQRNVVAQNVAREGNSVQLRQLDAQERQQRAEAHSRIAADEQAEYNRLIAAATTTEEKNRLTLEREARRVQRSREYAAIMGGTFNGAASNPTAIAGTGPTSSSSGSALPTPAASSLYPITPIAPASVSTPAPAVPIPASSEVPATGRFGQFPEVRSQEQLQPALMSFRPNFYDLWAASPFREDVLGSQHADAYRPPAGAWVDTNGNGKPDLGEFHDDNAKRYHLGAEATKGLLKQVFDEIGRINSDAGQTSVANPRGPNGVQNMYQHLMNKFGSTHGKDTIRWALAQAMDEPRWIQSEPNFDESMRQNNPEQWARFIARGLPLGGWWSRYIANRP